jgi:L-asparaginase
MNDDRRPEASPHRRVGDQRPMLRLFSLGGTIAMQASGTGGVEPAITGDELLRHVPEIADLADIVACQVRQVPSAHLTCTDIVELAELIHRAASSCDGVVVTVGTDALAEIAFGLDLLIGSSLPVIVTGSMRHPSQPGADGPANLLAAIQTCVSIGGRGVHVVMNDEIHAPVFVRKMHTSATNAFASPSLGPIGRVTEGRAEILVSNVLRPPRLRMPDRFIDVPVAFWNAMVGDDGLMLNALLEDRPAGLIVEALGGGHVTPAAAEKLEQLANRLPVLLTSRAGSGRVLQTTYGYLGSEIDLLARGIQSAGWLDGPKAYVFLKLVLGSGGSVETVRRLLHTSDIEEPAPPGRVQTRHPFADTR